MPDITHNFVDVMYDITYNYADIIHDVTKQKEWPRRTAGSVSLEMSTFIFLNMGSPFPPYLANLVTQLSRKRRLSQ